MYAVDSHIEVDIRFRFGMPKRQMRGVSIFPENWLPWQRNLRYRKRDPDRSSAPETFSINEKIAKIGPVDPEIIVLRAIIEKWTRNEWQSQAYSPLGTAVSPHSR